MVKRNSFAKFFTQGIAALLCVAAPSMAAASPACAPLTGVIPLAHTNNRTPRLLTDSATVAYGIFDQGSSPVELKSYDLLNGQINRIETTSPNVHAVQILDTHFDGRAMRIAYQEVEAIASNYSILRLKVFTSNGRTLANGGSSVEVASGSAVSGSASYSNESFSTARFDNGYLVAEKRYVSGTWWSQTFSSQILATELSNLSGMRVVSSIQGIQGSSSGIRNLRALSDGTIIWDEVNPATQAAHRIMAKHISAPQAAPAAQISAQNVATALNEIIERRVLGADIMLSNVSAGGTVSVNATVLPQFYSVQIPTTFGETIISDQRSPISTVQFMAAGGQVYTIDVAPQQVAHSAPAQMSTIIRDLSGSVLLEDVIGSGGMATVGFRAAVCIG